MQLTEKDTRELNRVFLLWRLIHICDVDYVQKLNRGWCWSNIVQHFNLWSGWWDKVHPQQVCRYYKTVMTACPHQMGVPIQRELDRLEKWPNRNLPKLSKELNQEDRTDIADSPFQIFPPVLCIVMQKVDSSNILRRFWNLT